MNMRINFKTINLTVKLQILLIFCMVSSCKINYIQIIENQTDSKLAGLYYTNFHDVDTGEPYREYLYFKEDSSVFYFHSTFDCDAVKKSKNKIILKSKYIINDNKIDFTMDYSNHEVKYNIKYSCKLMNNSLVVIYTMKRLDEIGTIFSKETIYYKCVF